MGWIKRCAATLAALVLMTGAACAGEEDTAMKTYTDQEQQTLSAQFRSVSITQTLKQLGYDSPVMTQRFGADPWALVYGDRVYLYMTGDVLQYDAAGNVAQNTYGQINTIRVVSSSDLINWTDHGEIVAAGKGGAAKWGGNSWAPCVACKTIDGQDKFFLYFANGGNGIGVLTADSPTGPFTDPLGHALISRSTPNCGNVAWLFDPAVLVDDDGSAYLYFGGGIPGNRTAADPGTARVVQLGEDMISLEGTPQALDVPFLFEDSGIHKIGDTYYYSYCSNWQMTRDDVKQYGFDNAQIVYMTSDSPMGPFTLQGAILKNPGTYFGCYGNNHHSIFSFRGQWYIAYHTQLLEKPLGISGGYRSTSVSLLKVNEDGSIPTLTYLTRNQLKQTEPFDPFTTVSAATMCTQAGLQTAPADPAQTCGEMVVTDIHPGDWLALSGVDINGALSFTVTLRGCEGHPGAIQLLQDRMSGTVLGYADWDGTQDTVTVTTRLTAQAEGTHPLILLLDGEGYELVSWQLGK